MSLFFFLLSFMPYRSIYFTYIAYVWYCAMSAVEKNHNAQHYRGAYHLFVSIFLKINIYFWLKGDCFTILCLFLPYINMSTIDIRMSPPYWTSLPSPTPSNLSRLSQNTWLKKLISNSGDKQVKVMNTMFQE